jgi:hypothetical protein
MTTQQSRHDNIDAAPIQLQFRLLVATIRPKWSAAQQAQVAGLRS